MPFGLYVDRAIGRSNTSRPPPAWTASWSPTVGRSAGENVVSAARVAAYPIIFIFSSNTTVAKMAVAHLAMYPKAEGSIWPQRSVELLPPGIFVLPSG
jgi:hypothetical protein